MSMTEVRNITARCIDKNSIEESVLHRVDFEMKESGSDWVAHSMEIMASDPMDAIKAVRVRMYA